MSLDASGILFRYIAKAERARIDNLAAVNDGDRRTGYIVGNELR